MGRSTATNLTGMLTSMGDTIGEMGGAGNGYVETFKRSMAPQIDTQDSKSLESYANWARRNGYGEEADKYMALAYKQKEVEKQEAKDAALGKTMAEATQSSTLGQKLGAKGDLGGADATIDSLRKRLDNPDIQKNPLAVEAIQEEIRGLQASRPDFVAKNTQAIAQGAAKMDQNIAALSEDDPQYDIKKAKLLEARDRFLQQPNVAEAYEGNKLKMMELNNKQEDAMWKQKSPAILAEMNANADDPDKLQGVMDKYPQFATQMLAVQGTILDLAQQRNEIRGANFRVEQLGPKIDREIKELEESDLPEPIKKQAIDLLGRSKSYLSAGEVHPPSALANYDKLRGQVDQLLINEAASQAGVIRQREQRAEVRVESAKQAAQKGPQPGDVIALLELKTGETWDKLNKSDPGKAKELYDEVEAELMAPLLEYWERAEIAAGNEPYKELDMEDVRTIKSEYKELSDENSKAGIETEKYEVFIQRKAYELAARGYEKDAVTRLLSKETNMSLTDALEYYDAIMADIEVNDDRISGIVRQLQENPSRNESIASVVYEQTALKRARGNRVVDPNAVSDDHATRTRKLLSDPDNLYQGVNLSPSKNKLADAYAEQNAGRGFRYPSLSELQPIDKNNRVR